ncbi:MAG: S8 family serine peptidase [Pseudomonadota bacterium]
MISVAKLVARPLGFLLLTSALVLAPLALPHLRSGGMAWADDHNDGGDGGGDDDDDDGGGAASRAGRDASGRSGPGRTTGPLRRLLRGQAPVTAQRPPAVVLPRFAPEIVVTDLTATDRALLLAEGFAVIADDRLPGIGPEPGSTITRLSAPPAVSLDSARARVRLLPSGIEADLNHYYRSGQAGDALLPVTAPTPCTAEICAAQQMIDWPENRATCPVTVTVGVIDTGVNAAHQMLEGAQIRVVTLADTTQDPSRAVHGTAVVSLLAGAATSRVPGLIPEARLIVADVFGRGGGDERADVVSVMKALHLMASEGVRVVNMSLAGPENTVLDQAISRFTATDGMVIVAAAGNGGPDAAAAFPASHPGVVAVTAVDGRTRIYNRAQRGDHLDLAAPGVNLLLATSVSGARLQTGTSFAAPFVTAAAAVLLSQGLTRDEVSARLTATARDLGRAGADPIFGNGLLSAARLCG